MKLIPEAKQWYKITSMQATMLVAALEVLRTTDIIVLPPWVMLPLIIAIAVLRVIPQHNLKRGNG